MNKILLIEDDEAISGTLRNILTEHGFIVQTILDGAQALPAINKALPDLVLLDLGLPNISGESICKEVHRIAPDLPIIILTAKNQSADVVHGLSLGAVDYIPKPFDIDELLARIAVRLKSVDSEILQADDLIVNTKTMQVTRGNITILLTPHEFRLLHYLLMNKGRVLTREMILNRVWQYAYDVDTRVVDVYIGYLRKKIESPDKKQLIIGVRGFGYMIEDE